MILASLAGAAACSGEAPPGNTMIPGTSEPTTPVTPGINPTTPVTPGVTPPTGVTPGVNPPGVTPTNPPVTPTTGPTDTTEPPPPPPGLCVPGVPTTSQVPRLTNVQYDKVVRDVLGVNPTGASWSDGFELDTRGELSNTQWGQYQARADVIAKAVMGAPLGAELTTAAASAATLETAVTNLGRKMFRRPMTEAEITSFMSLMDVQPPGTAAEIAEVVVYAFLVSPNFIMRLELDAPSEMVPGTEAKPQTAVKLSSYEVASRLSFLLWNSVPDTALNAAADANELQTAEQIQAQAARMLGAEFEDRVTSTIVSAHRFWANIDETSSLSRWGKTSHNKEIFPAYDDAQTAPFMAETDALFAEIGFGGQFEDLFLTKAAYVNQATAPLYGATGNFTADLTRVELDATERPGILTRGAFLSSFAHEDDTSPILRGAFIVTLMGGSVGNPDPEALKTPIPPGTYQNNREAVTALTSVEPACIACHNTIINPPGFVLENFSAIGSIQTTDPGWEKGPIDTKVDTVAFPDGARPVNNALELMQGIAAGRRTKEIYAEKYVSYATGRDANGYDQCTATAIADKIDAGGYVLANILGDISQAVSFRYRVAGQ